MLETLATCENCAMVKPQGLTKDPGPFLGNLKCCTYFPYLPNFTLGQFSYEQYPSLQGKSEFLPMGLYPSHNQQIFVETHIEDGFGKNPDLLCPFFSKKENQCSIWQFRPGVCTSYFCKSNRAEKGLEFWQKVENYLNHFEWKMAQEILYRMGFTENEIAFCQSVLSPETEEDEREFFRQAAWLKPAFYQDKKSFYDECFRMGKSVSSTEIQQLLDPEYLELEEEIQSFTKIE